MSVKYLSAIQGPEVAAPILWAREKMRSFCRKTSMSIKFLVLGGRVFWVLGGVGSADFIFMGAGIFLTKNRKWRRQTGVRQSHPYRRQEHDTEIQYRLPRCLQNQRVNSASNALPLQRIKEKSRYGISVLTPHRRYGHRLRTPFLRTPFPRLPVFDLDWTLNRRSKTS